jgi:hypothetical protein
VFQHLPVTKEIRKQGYGENWPFDNSLYISPVVAAENAIRSLLPMSNTLCKPFHSSRIHAGRHSREKQFKTESNSKQHIANKNGLEIGKNMKNQQSRTTFLTQKKYGFTSSTLRFHFIT